VQRVRRCPADFYRRLYRDVGRAHRWVDRLGWTDAQIRDHLDRSDVTLWLLWAAGAPAGYYELRADVDGSVEIAYFGLLPSYIGRGYGRFLLADAVRRAWTLAPTRVWLHTASYDHEHALANYLARGFLIVRRESLETGGSS
jgi:GNAT superfamily N-acetyltransferase